MGGNIVLACVVLAFIWKSGECDITGWTKPTIAAADENGVLDEKINDGSTNGDTTGITITATSDVAGEILYNIASQNPNTPVLEIGKDGVVSVTSGTIDYSTTAAFTLSVVATDAASTEGTATVTLNVNAAPSIATHNSSTCIPDGSVQDTVLIELEATDPNPGTIFAWAIASGDANSDFTITTAGIIQVATGKTLNMVTTASYTLVITAADDSSMPLTATTTVTASVQTTCPSTTSQTTGSTTITLSLLTLLFALRVTQLS